MQAPPALRTSWETSRKNLLVIYGHLMTGVKSCCWPQEPCRFNAEVRSAKIFSISDLAATAQKTKDTACGHILRWLPQIMGIQPQAKSAMPKAFEGLINHHQPPYALGSKFGQPHVSARCPDPTAKPRSCAGQIWVAQFAFEISQMANDYLETSWCSWKDWSLSHPFINSNSDLALRVIVACLRSSGLTVGMYISAVMKTQFSGRSIGENFCRSLASFFHPYQQAINTPRTQ